MVYLYAFDRRDTSARTRMIRDIPSSRRPVIKVGEVFYIVNYHFFLEDRTQQVVMDDSVFRYIANFLRGDDDIYVDSNVSKLPLPPFSTIKKCHSIHSDEIGRTISSDRNIPDYGGQLTPPTQIHDRYLPRDTEEWTSSAQPRRISELRRSTRLRKPFVPYNSAYSRPKGRRRRAKRRDKTPIDDKKEALPPMPRWFWTAVFDACSARNSRVCEDLVPVWIRRDELPRWFDFLHQKCTK